MSSLLAVSQLSPRYRYQMLALILAMSAYIAVPEVQAKQAEASKKAKSDPNIVILRDVTPRIAYRAVPKEDLRVSASATVFPSKVFHQTLGKIVDATASDADLMQHASVGLLVSSTDSSSPRSATARLQTSLSASAANSNVGIGAGAAARRIAGNGGVADRITSVTGQLTTMIPAAIHQVTPPVAKPSGPGG
jgi:hypothetical protein